MTKQDQIQHLINEIFAWNKKINLTGLKTKKDIQTVLIDQSLKAEQYIPDKEGIKVVDIGTGAGIPGLPLKIQKPNITLDLVDKNKKKITFIKKIIRDLKLNNTQTHARDYRTLLENPEYQHAYDFVLVRGLGADNTEIDILRKFLNKTGKLIIWETEQKELKINVLG